MIDRMNQDSGSYDPSDRTAAILRANQERAAARQSQIEALAAPGTSADERIRLWERLHGLNLPRDAQHKLLRIIARDTQLTLRQVQDEQSRRASPSTL
jgi:hypothetical protein